MDGVLLTGGLASRLGPITKVTNKHLLPIYDKPMIYYGIELLRDLGCERVIIILGGNSVGDIVNLVRDGSHLGVEVVYQYQSEPKGISHAINTARNTLEWGEPFGPPEKFLVLLGDNIFASATNLRTHVDEWRKTKTGLWHETRWAVFFHSSETPHEYGQPILTDEGMTIERFVEKDSSVDHKLIVTGLYGLDVSVFNEIENQKPSKRGEFEITDTLTTHLPYVDWYGYHGFWSDCGTPEGLVEASLFMKGKGQDEVTSKR